MLKDKEEKGKKERRKEKGKIGRKKERKKQKKG